MDQTLWIPSKYFPPRPSVELITVAADPQWRREKICRRRSSGARPLRDGWSMEAIHEEGPVCNLPLNLFTSQSFNWSNVQLFKCSTVQMFKSGQSPQPFYLPILQLIAQQFPPYNPTATHARSRSFTWPSFFDRIWPSKANDSKFGKETSVGR